MKNLVGYLLILNCVILFGCAKEEDVIQSSDFIGKWNQEYQFWHLYDSGVDTMINNYFNSIEFFDDGTSLQVTPQGEFEYDWFYREMPRQIYFTQVNEVWASDELYDITEITQNSQIWERRFQLSQDKVALYKFILTRAQ